MTDKHENPLSVGQIDADLYMARMAIERSEEISVKAAKHLRALAGYHLQQAAEKLIKIQIYASEAQIDNAKMYRHSLNDLMQYAISLGVKIVIPSWVDDKKFIISRWEAEGRYNLHLVVRIDTLKRCYQEIVIWRERLFPGHGIGKKNLRTIAK